jgi:hypothetical protein
MVGVLLQRAACEATWHKAPVLVARQLASVYVDHAIQGGRLDGWGFGGGIRYH